MKKLIMIVLVLIVGFGFIQLPTDSLSDSEKASLQFMREEEKLARDVYLKLYKQWQLMPFRNIARSEQMHMDMILNLLQQYDLRDPVGENAEGVFVNKELQQLYNELIEKGLKSEIEALRVGAYIEEVDIRDLQQALDQEIERDDIASVYNQLLNGSYNHLRAFTRNLEQRGVTYVPTVLNQSVYENIAAGTQGCNNKQSCKGDCSGQGKNGQGKGKKRANDNARGSY